jgi:hypothetical protein
MGAEEPSTCIRRSWLAVDHKVVYHIELYSSGEKFMQDLLELQIVFSENQALTQLSQKELLEKIQGIFEQIGLEPKFIEKHIVNLELRKESPLGVDPGTAALGVAIIGFTMELIKQAIDLYKHRQQMELQRQELAIKKSEAQEQIESDQEKPESVDREAIRVLVDEFIIAQLVQQQNLQISNSNLRIIRRRS